MKRSSLFTLGLALFLFVISSALYGLEYYFLEQAKTHGIELEKSIAEKKNEVARAQLAQSSLASLGADEERVRSYSLSRKDIVPFLESLQNTGTTLGADVQVLSVSEDRATTHPKVSISLRINGSFDSVLKTIGTLENAPYDSGIPNLTLSSEGQVKGPTRWSAATTLTVGLQRYATSTPSKP